MSSYITVLLNKCWRWSSDPIRVSHALGEYFQWIETYDNPARGHRNLRRRGHRLRSLSVWRLFSPLSLRAHSEIRMFRRCFGHPTTRGDEPRETSPLWVSPTTWHPHRILPLRNKTPANKLAYTQSVSPMLNAPMNIHNGYCPLRKMTYKRYTLFSDTPRTKYFNWGILKNTVILSVFTNVTHNILQIHLIGVKVKDNIKDKKTHRL